MLSFQQEPLEMYHGGIRLIKIHVLLISSGVKFIPSVEKC